MLISCYKGLSGRSQLMFIITSSQICDVLTKHVILTIHLRNVLRMLINHL